MWNWSQNGIWWNDVECPTLFTIFLWANVIFSCCCYHQPFPGVHSVKRSEMVLGTEAAVEWKNGRLVSSRVGSGERRSLTDSTQASLFFRFASNRLDKLSTKAVIQSMSDYYRYFLRVSSGTTFYKRGIDTKDKIKASPVVYRTTLIIATVICCNQIMTQKRI